MTYTYVLLEVSGAAYEEIRKAMKEAGYSHSFQKEDGQELIDMSQIAITKKQEGKK